MRTPVTDPLLVEKIETLFGEGARGRRPEIRHKAAVRIEDFADFLKLNRTLQSAQVSGTPTAAEYNALQTDVAELHNRLVALQQALTGRLT